MLSSEFDPGHLPKLRQCREPYLLLVGMVGVWVSKRMMGMKRRQMQGINPAGNKPCREARSLYITQRAPAWFGARAEQAASTSADVLHPRLEMEGQQSCVMLEEESREGESCLKFPLHQNILGSGKKKRSFSQQELFGHLWSVVPSACHFLTPGSAVGDTSASRLFVYFIFTHIFTVG